ncbi:MULTISPECIES: hypothetical protein [unclassified Streptococcus]|uniref:hypothetical protein n=1 Tax=unclassified Streptococcus TaxID=2608887 RepID=UPI00359DAD11
MRYYLARVLTEMVFDPPRSDYSSFSELIIIGRAKMNLDYSRVLYDDRRDILDQLLAEYENSLALSYQTADNHRLTRCLREIVKLEEILDHISLGQELIEVDERLYTFDHALSFEAFKTMYEFGQFGG